MQNNILNIECKKFSVLKHFFKYIKCHYDDIVISFRSQNTDDKPVSAIRISELTPNKDLLFKINIDVKYFDVYQCKKDIDFCVNTNDFYDAINKIKTVNGLLMYIKKDKKCILNIKDAKNGFNKTKLTKINRDDYHPIPIPNTKFIGRHTLNMDAFMTLCQYLSDVDIVQVTASEKIITFGKKSSSSINEPDIFLTYGTQFDVSKTSNLYPTKYLMSLKKFKAIVPTIDIYNKEDFPLVLAVHLGKFGNLFIFIALH